MICRRNAKCIAHQAGFISDKDYYADVVTPRPMDLTGNLAMLQADEMRKRFLESRPKQQGQEPGKEKL